MEAKPSRPNLLLWFVIGVWASIVFSTPIERFVHKVLDGGAHGASDGKRHGPVDSAPNPDQSASVPGAVKQPELLVLPSCREVLPDGTDQPLHLCDLSKGDA